MYSHLFPKPLLHGIDLNPSHGNNRGMGRSSTTFTSIWQSGKTTVIRVPDILSADVLEYARQLDVRSTLLKSPEVVYRTAANVSAETPVNVAAVPQRSPFRYPGGKTWLVPYARTWLSNLYPKPAVLIEPFAGGRLSG